MPAVGSGTECPGLGVLAPGDDPEELLLDDVGHGPDPALEDLRLLEHGGLDLSVAIAVREVRGNGLEAREFRRFDRQQVARPPRGLERASALGRAVWAHRSQSIWRASRDPTLGLLSALPYSGSDGRRFATPGRAGLF